MNALNYFTLGLGLLSGLTAGYYVARRLLEVQAAKERHEKEEEEKRLKERAKNSADGNGVIWEEEAMEALDKYRPREVSTDLTAERQDTSTVSKEKPEKIFEDGPILIPFEDYIEDDTRETVVIDWWCGYTMATDETETKIIENVDELVSMDNIEQIVISGSEIGYVRNGNTIYQVNICTGEPLMFGE